MALTGLTGRLGRTTASKKSSKSELVRVINPHIYALRERIENLLEQVNSEISLGNTGRLYPGIAHSMENVNDFWKLVKPDLEYRESNTIRG